MFYGNSILLERWAWEKWFTGENNVGIQIWAIENAHVPCHSKRSIVSWRYAFRDNRFTLLNCILIFPAWWMATAHNCTNVHHAAHWKSKFHVVIIVWRFTNRHHVQCSTVHVQAHAHVRVCHVLLSCEWFACISFNIQSHFTAFNSQSYQIHRLRFLWSFWKKFHSPTLVSRNPGWHRSAVIMSMLIGLMRGRKQWDEFQSKQLLLSSSSFYGALFFSSYAMLLSRVVWYDDICYSDKRSHMSYAFFRNFRAIVLYFRGFPSEVYHRRCRHH